MAASAAMAMLRSMVAASAIHNGDRDEKDDYTRVCHPGTREKQLENLKKSANNSPPEMRVEWLYAIAGTGKTAMLRTFCTDLEEQNGFPSISFFVWKGDARRNTLRLFPATIAYQLSRRIPALVPCIEKAINEDPVILQSAFKKQMDELVIRPLLDCCDAVKSERHLIVVVVDGLDELDELDEKGLLEFLSFIPYFISRLASLPISLLVSSRPDAEIVAAFKHPDLASITRSTRLGASDEDIWKFINDKFDDINIRYPNLQIECSGEWPSHVKRAIMVTQSSGLFIWPTVAIDYIDKVKLGLGHNKRLEQVLSSAEPKPWIASPLDNLYRAILQAHAPEDPEDLLRFNQRLAYLCLPVGLDKFVLGVKNLIFDWSDTPVRVVFSETLDELWDSVTGLSSFFSPRVPPSESKSSTPGISHLSLRDFTFNRARCGDKFHYSIEQELHTEVVCKFLKFFNTRQAYQDCAEMSAQFIRCAGEFLGSHLKKGALSEELGRCIDDVILEVIPPTWPLVAQIYLIVTLFDNLYVLTKNLNFPEGERRQTAFLSKLAVFLKSRAGIAEGWDIALLRLALSTTDFESHIVTLHSVQCWHIARSRQCACVHAYIRNIPLLGYQDVLGKSILIRHAKSQLLPDGQDDVAQDSITVMHFFLSLSETSSRATQLSSFIRVSDDWIQTLLKHCPPNNDLYSTLGHICTAALPDLPQREEDDTWELVEVFLEQTDAFNAYAKLRLDAGIEKKSPPIKIPDDWWDDKGTRYNLLRRGYKPSFDIPDEWWEEWKTGQELLRQGYIPPNWATSRAGSPMSLFESDSEYATSHFSSSQPQPLPLSSSKPPSITSSSDIDLDVEDVLHASLPIDTPHAEPAPLPATVPVEEVVVSEANGTPTSDVEDTGMTLPTIIPSRALAHAGPIPDSVSGINVAQPLGQRRRAGVRTFFNKLIRRP